MPEPPDFDDDRTPLPATLLNVAQLPMEFALLRQTVVGHAKMLKELKDDRKEQTKGFRNIWLAIAGLIVTIALAAAGAFTQMGQYMERIDNVRRGQDNIVRRLDNLATTREQPGHP